MKDFALDEAGFDTSNDDLLFESLDQFAAEETDSQAAEEEVAAIREIEEPQIQQAAERADIFRPEVEPDVADLRVKPTELQFDDELITPSKDETSFVDRRLSEVADIRSGAAELGQRLPTGDAVFTASGMKPGNEGFEEAVFEENRKGKGILEFLSDNFKDEDFSEESFEYGRYSLSKPPWIKLETPWLNQANMILKVKLMVKNSMKILLV